MPTIPAKPLQQHLRDSPAHAPYCEERDRTFCSNEALEQHFRDFSVHAQTEQPSPSIMDSSFRSDEALEQHLQHSSEHASSLHCTVPGGRFLNCSLPITITITTIS